MSIAVIDWPVCATCGRPAACLGAYEGAEVEEYACDVCCLHGCEDGLCEQLEEPALLGVGDA